MAAVDSGLTGRHGPLVIDWPRSAGYFSGVGLAVGLGIVEPPLGIFIAAVPFFKMLNVNSASRPLRLVAQFYEGMAKPVGGDGEGTIALASGMPRRLRRSPVANDPPVRRGARAKPAPRPRSRHQGG